MFFRLVFLSVLLGASHAYAASCPQPVTIINIGNLACVDPKTGKWIHNEYQGPYTQGIYSDDEKNDWYRGDFYGLDDD